MKFVLVLYLLWAGLAPSKQDLKLEPSPKCIKDSGATPEDVKALADDTLDNASPTLKCLIQCAMEDKDITNGEGELKKDELEEKIEDSTLPEEKKDEIDEKLEKCNDEKGDDECDKAYNTLMCFKGKKT